MSPRRVLVIDDEADIREVIQAALELTAGWEVTTAASGPDGLALATAAPPEAILLDVQMPGMDGLRALEHLRADPTTRAIPVVLVTAKLQASDRRAYQALGVAGLIEKPFDPVLLADRLAQAVGWSA